MEAVVIRRLPPCGVTFANGVRIAGWLIAAEDFTWRREDDGAVAIRLQRDLDDPRVGLFHRSAALARRGE